MITTKVEVVGVEFNDYQRLKVNKAISDYNSSSNFQITYDSPFGKHANSFPIGQDIEIFADDSDGTTTLLYGIIERVQFRGRGKSQFVDLFGRDYSLKLQDATVEPIVFTDTEISDIVKSIISNNVSNITTTNVETTETTLKRIVFNHTNVFKALQQLAELAGYFFYIDNNRDLNFKKRENISSGITLDNTNINKSTLNKTREGMSNYIHIYGNRALAGYQETFTQDGGGGSVFTLLSKPRSTSITVNGVHQIGGVFELTVEPVSGPQYLVSFDDRLIVFISGTDIGYDSVPANGSIIVVDYDRDIPIVKFGQDRESILLYGKKELIINDKTINDPNTATAILKKELKNANPFNGVECEIKGWYDITPGNTASVVLDNFNINEEVGILNVKYIFDKNTVNSEKIIEIRLDKKIIDITDEITDIRKRLNAIEEADRQEADTITRLEQAENQFSVVGSYWEIRESVVTGSGYHVYSIGFIPPVNPFHCASGTDQGLCAGSFTGSAQIFTDFTTVRSGGFLN